MKIKLLALAILSVINFSYSQEKLVIPGASYAKAVLWGSSERVRYYTFDGNLLCECNDSGLQENRMDKSAPKPRPISYKITYRNGYKMRPGYWIAFYDKNGNNLGSFPWHKNAFYDASLNYSQSISRLEDLNKDLDLSIVQKIN